MGDYGRDRDSGRGSSRGRDGGDDRGRDRDSGRDSGRGEGRGRERGGDSSRGASSRFSYQARSREDVEKRASMGANEFDSFLKDHIKVYKPKPKENRIRILPPTWAKPKHYGLDIYVHYAVGPDRQSYLDLFKMLEKPDPITEEIEELRRSGDASEDQIKRMDSKRRVLVYLVDRDNEAEGVQAYAMPWTLDKDISLLSVDSSDGSVINIDDPEEGYDVSFYKEGDKDRTKYTGVSIARRSSRLGKSAWLDFAIDNPLPDQLVYYPYDEIAKAFGGGGSLRESDRARDRDEDRGDARGRDSASDRDGSGHRDDPRDLDGRGVGGRGERGRDDRGGGDERGGARERERVGRAREPEPAALTWEQVHDMTADELDALCSEDDRLDKINPDDAKTDAELADWICEDLGISKPEPTSTRRRASAEPPPDDASDRLRRMREERSGGGR